jgi:hypothetical protein
MKMTNTLLSLIISLASIVAADEFTGLKCGDNIAQKLIGRKSKNERVVVIEERHKDLGLKDLGASMGDDESISYITWQICDSRYAFIMKDGRIKDVYKFPATDSGNLEFMGPCKVGVETTPEYYVGILQGSGSDSLLTPIALSKISEQTLKFEPESPNKFKCYRANEIKPVPSQTAVP